MKRSLVALLLTISLLCLSVLGQMRVTGQMRVVTTAGGGGGGGTPFILTQTLGTLRNDFAGCVGIVFDTPGSSPPTISELGRWKVAGNAGTHKLSLQSCSGNDCTSGSIELASVSADMTTGSAGGYVYFSITPVALATSQRYVVVSEEASGGDQWYDSSTTVNSVSSAAGTHVGGIYTSVGGCVGGLSVDGSGANVPTNFKFTP